MGPDSPVATNILKKAELLKNGDSRHSSIRPAILFDGGGMKGIFGKGVAMGLEAAGLTDAFDTIVGGSAGACNALYFAAKQAELASTVYLDDLTDERFISWSRICKVMDIDYLADTVFRKMKKLDVEALQRSHSRLLVALTCALTGEGGFVDVKKCEDPVEVLKASIALPVLYGRKVLHQRQPYVDGQMSMPLPIIQLVENAAPTDLLVVLNKPLCGKPERLPVWQWFLINILFVDSPKIRKMLLERNQIRNENIALLASVCGRTLRGVNIDVICPEMCGVRTTTRDRRILQRFLEHGIDLTERIFKRR